MRAQRFTVRMRYGSSLRKLFTFGFQKSDGSIWLSCPYFHEQGIVSELTMEAGQFGPIDLGLTPAGSVTAHQVKYVHHRSGAAHFSLTGKVRTEVRRMSVPLYGIDTHLLTVQIEGLGAFDEDVAARADGPWEDERKQRTLTFLPVDPPDSKVKFVFRGFSKKRIRNRTRSTTTIGPRTRLIGNDGKLRGGVLVSAPSTSKGSSTFLILTVEGLPRSDDGLPSFSMIGGFDPPAIAGDPRRSTSFLAMLYGAGAGDRLPGNIPSIDIEDRG